MYFRCNSSFVLEMVLGKTEIAAFNIFFVCDSFASKCYYHTFSLRRVTSLVHHKHSGLKYKNQGVNDESIKIA